MDENQNVTKSQLLLNFKNDAQKRQLELSNLQIEISINNVQDLMTNLKDIKRRLTEEQILYEQGILGIISFLYLFKFNLIRLSKVFSEDKNRSIIILLQIILLAISLNSINLLDHTFFWVVLALTLSKKVNYSQAEV